MKTHTKWIGVIVALLFAGATAARAQETIVGTADDSSGVWLFSAGESDSWTYYNGYLYAGCFGEPAGEPTDDIVEQALDYSLLTYLGDAGSEVLGFWTGPNQPNDTGTRDSTMNAVVEGLTEIDDFGLIENASQADQQANFDSGAGGWVMLALDEPLAIVADGVTATGTLGPDDAGNASEAEDALDGFEIFIFEDAELSGMNITLYSRDNVYSIAIADRQVDPDTQGGADDTLIAIDLDSLAGWDGTYIREIQIQDEGTQMQDGTCGLYGDTTMELDAVAVRHDNIVELATLGDFVWLDENENGVQDGGSELGLANVTVQLLDTNDNVLSTTSTDANGAYSFGVTAGTYVVKFVLPDSTYEFTTANQGGDDALDSDADVLSGKSHQVTVAAGGSDLTLDCGMYAKPTLVVLNDFAVDVVDGRVVVRWETAAEFGTIGFFLERWDAASETFVSVNDSIVPAALDSSDLQTYETVDAGAPVNGSLTYRLVELENTGRRNVYGPFTIDVTDVAGDAAVDETDTDGDGMTDVQEQAAGTNPADAASVLRVSSMQAVGGNVVLRWASVPGVSYKVERGDSVSGPFETVASHVPATAPENVVILVDAATVAFYRVTVQD